MNELINGLIHVCNTCTHVFVYPFTFVFPCVYIICILYIGLQSYKLYARQTFILFYFGERSVF